MEDHSKEATPCVTVMLSTFKRLQKEPKLLRTGQRGAVKGQLLEGL